MPLSSDRQGDHRPGLTRHFELGDKGSVERHQLVGPHNRGRTENWDGGQKEREMESGRTT